MNRMKTPDEILAQYEPLSEAARLGFYRLYRRLHPENQEGVRNYLQSIFNSRAALEEDSLRMELEFPPPADTVRARV